MWEEEGGLARSESRTNRTVSDSRDTHLLLLTFIKEKGLTLKVSAQRERSQFMIYDS